MAGVRDQPPLLFLGAAEPSDHRREAGRHAADLARGLGGLRVVAVTPAGPDAVTIEIEGHHLNELRAEAGQFFRWRFMTPDHWGSAHPFSLSAPPTDRRLRLTVKALGAGTRKLQNLEVGTRVVAEGPYGALTAGRRTQADVLLIAGGVGITRLRALFETIPLATDDDLVLLYRARSPAHPCSATSSTREPPTVVPASSSSSAGTTTACRRGRSPAPSQRRRA